MNDETKELKEAIAVPSSSVKEIKLAHSKYELQSANASENPWKDPAKEAGKEVDYDGFVETVDMCNFFYTTEPLVATVVNKLVEIGINDLTISKNGLSDNEFRVFMALKPRLIEYAETLAQEFFLSGLVVPEISYGAVDKDTIFELGIKKYSRLIFPVSMWIRDPKTIKINSSVMSDQPSYYFVVPDEMVSFIKQKGEYEDGRKDPELFLRLKTYYPEFVKEVQKGTTEFLLDSKLIIRRKYLPNNPYPIPYISPVLDALQHKRKMRRVDYSIMDKILGAILHVRVGSDLFPVTADEEDVSMLDDLRNQLRYRFMSDQNLERIFQFITNHTVEMNWVSPNTDLLRDANKYNDINHEILFGLGFPRVLITGEVEKTGTSDADIALISPVKTMEAMRRKVIKIIREICKQVALQNNFKAPTVNFKSLNLHAFKEFMESLFKAYDSSAISRTALAESLGYDIMEQLDNLEVEKTELDKRELSGVGVQPYSSPDLKAPNNKTNPNENQPPEQNQEPPATQK